MALLTEHADQDSLGGGRFRQTIAIKRIAYRRDGNLRRIMDALGNTGDPALSIGADELAQFRVADRLAGQSPVIHFGKGGSNVRLTPLATNNVDAVVAGNVVTYPEAWDNADLRLSIGGHILRKEILLRTGHPSSFAFRIANHAGLDIDTLETPDFRILQPSLEGPNGQHIPLVWGVSSSGGKYILTATLPPGDYAGWVVDPTLILQPDATDGKDGYIRGDTPTINFGVTDPLALGWYSAVFGPYRAIYEFDTSSIPATATINSASLQLKRAGNFGTEAYSIGAYAVVRAWIEGTGDSAASGDGATWATYDGSNNWGTAGCDNTTTDRSGSAENAHAPNYPADESWSIPVMAQDWVTTPANNKGVILLTTSAWVAQGLWQGYSSDNATAANRPKLTIEYTLPATGMSRAPIASWCH